MKKFKYYPQKLYLFFVYGSLILLLLCIFFAYFYRTYSKNTFRDAKKQAENMCTSLNNSIQGELDNISTISMNIVYSNMIRTSFQDFSATNQNSGVPPDNFSVSRNSALAIYDAITSIIGPFQSATQVNLYTPDGDYVGSGYLQSAGHIDLADLSWFPETVRLNGFKYITAPEMKLHFPSSGENQNSLMFLSLTRQFNNRAGDPEGYIEVIQDCQRIFGLASQLREGNPAASIYIYNERGQLVYPYRPEELPVPNQMELIKQYDLKPLEGKMVAFAGEPEVLFTYQTNDDYDWTVMVVNTKDSVYAPLQSFRNSFLAILTFSTLATMALCFVISSRMTKPLTKLSHATTKITLDRVLDDKQPVLSLGNSRISEISLLCNSIQEMYDKLRESSEEVLLSRSEETRAKLQATQSLINPHFLYNSLTTISVMAEEEMNDSIVFLCNALCDYFRYISDSESMMVTLSQEVFYTKKYIDCMQIRFGSEFTYQADLPENTLNLLIPKLILQPIVENAFKYAYHTKPPWTLKISARLQADSWIIEIEDNGGLLDPDRKNELLKSYQNLDKKEELKSLKIGGMGLKTVYLRMQLLYGEKALFQIDISTPGKTVFLLGGPIIKNLEV